MLRQLASLVFLVAAFCPVLPANASLKDIDSAKLPKTAAVSQTYADILEVEPMTREWHDAWQFPRSKEDVVSLLRSTIKTLQEANSASPENEELWLFTGLVAHYAYNVDVDGSYELATKAFAAARGLSPQDHRPDWFEAALVCQTQQSVRGMESFLSIESRFPWKNLAASFWDDYLACSIVTVMPAHSLRALDHLRALQPAPSDYRDSLADITRKRIQKADISGSYSQKDVWSSAKLANEIEFTNTMFGLRFSTPQDWKLRLFDVQKGQTLAQLTMHPIKSSATEISPNILIVARPPKPGETLQSFLQSWMKYPKWNAAKLQNCPSDSCLALQGLDAGAYGPAGDGAAVLVAFERNAPESPGVLFEQPLPLPQSTNDQPAYFRPTQPIGRLSGTLYYVIMLDTASSVRDEAASVFETFLKGVQVE